MKIPCGRNAPRAARAINLATDVRRRAGSTGAAAAVALALALTAAPPAGAVPVLTATPSPMRFGAVPLGATSPPQTLLLTNTGTTTLTFATPFSAGPPNFGFSYVNGPTVCADGLTLAPGASCSYVVTLTPFFTGPQSTGALFFSDGGTVSWSAFGFGGELAVPALSPWMQGALAMLVGLLAVVALRRRNAWSALRR
jgi:hypothetical protein